MTVGHLHAAGRLDRTLAGLQAGTAGALTMLLWLGVCSVWRREDFWSSPNLLASACDPAEAFHSGFGWNTAFGGGLYILFYGTMGALFALAAGRPMTRLRLALIAMALSTGWYWIADRWLWRAVPPLAALLHGGSAVVMGHLIYGALLGRFPRHLPDASQPETAPPAAEQEAEVNSGSPAD